MRTVLPMCLSVALSIVAPVGAQGGLTVDEIVARNIAARGGYGKIKALKSIVYSHGLYEEDDYTSSGSAMMVVARPYYRVVGNPESPGGYMEGYDGAAWEWFADPGIVVRTVGAAAGAMRRGSDVEAAVALLEANAEAHPDSSSSAFGLGRAFATAGAPSRARAEFERALRLDPENRRARTALGSLEPGG